MNNHLPLGTKTFNIVFAGHVDHGKSTLIGRILWDTDSVPKEKKEAAIAYCQKNRIEFEYAFLLDSLLEERTQNITIDVTEVNFFYGQRRFRIIDAPGHLEFLKNMISGATKADAAVLVIDSSVGIGEQTKRHAMLLALLGIKQIVVALNKFDLVHYSPQAYKILHNECTQLLEKLELPCNFVIPLSAKSGENIIERSMHLSWYEGKPLLETLLGLDISASPENSPLRFPIQDVFRFDERRLLAGRIESGKLQCGELITFYPSGKKSKVKAIHHWPPESSPQVVLAGKSTAIQLEEEIFVERGEIIAHENTPPIVATDFFARIFWLGDQPLVLGAPYTFRLATQQGIARVLQIQRVIDAMTLEDLQPVPMEVKKNETAEVIFRTSAPIACDLFENVQTTGRFVFADQNRIAGGGIILKALPSKPVHEIKGRSRISAAQRAKFLGHRSGVFWMTGLSGSGKTTLSNRLEQILFHRGILAYVIDGDELRGGLSKDLGFDAQDRKENIRRAAETAKTLAKSGLVVIVALISPFEEDRKNARSICEKDGILFKEIYVDAPIEICKSRDPKFLYLKASKGEIPKMTGLDSPYEPPSNCDLHLLTAQESIETCLEKLLDFIVPLVRISPDKERELGLLEDPAAEI
ncbi:adenylyl-sulfate kinase [Methylacidiphilum kamchatkense]|uniref:Adenylyl-sulfate kinase n=1 Tax=Methylacidiphilum kamchatkense Kam1 TaxID=1202785 RepID=A0A516TKB8_9BACT|nr:adenylyl-sulfate kinase [Methylacidiphilum kamchatkense]QDQ41677.1 bifunctional enzyme CysN/CysC [Methylacidiphilum kamchatkense Kam1]